MYLSWQATSSSQPEFAHPYTILVPHAEISVASPAGAEAPLDPGSVKLFKDDIVCATFHKEQSHLWKNTDKLENYIGKAADFDLIYVVGGHGRTYTSDPSLEYKHCIRNSRLYPHYSSQIKLNVGVAWHLLTYPSHFPALWDLTDNTSSQKLLAEFYDSGKIVAAVCHGSCALLNVKIANGELIFKDQPVTGFSDEEEAQVGLDKAVPFLLETELIKKGGKYEKASAPWGAHVSVGRDGRLITGQNPASAAGIAELFLKHYKN